MAVFAVVNPSGGVVINTVIGADLESVSTVVGGAVEVTDDTGPGNIGYIWNPETGKFTPPEA